MSVDKVKIQMISIPSVPKLLKHSHSEHHSKLPEIRAMKMRQTLDPSTTFKVRNMTRAGSLIGPSKPSLLTQSGLGSHVKRQPS